MDEVEEMLRKRIEETNAKIQEYLKSSQSKQRGSSNGRIANIEPQILDFN